MTRRQPPAVDLERITLPDGPAPGIEHGRYTTYCNHGCRCQPCRDDNTRHVREWRQRRRSMTLTLDGEIADIVRRYADRHDISKAETIRRAVRLLTGQQQ